MIRKIMNHAKAGQIIVLVVLLGLLIFFLKDAGMKDIFIVISLAVAMGIIFVPCAEADNSDKDDLIDWKLIRHLSNKGD